MNKSKCIVMMLMHLLLFIIQLPNLTFLYFKVQYPQTYGNLPIMSLYKKNNRIVIWNFEFLTAVIHCTDFPTIFER